MLRLSVEAALKTRLNRSGAGDHRGAGIDVSKVRALETELRTAAGKIAEERTACLDATDALRECADDLVRTASKNLIEVWDTGASATGAGLIQNHLERVAAERAALISSAIQEVAGDAGAALANTALTLALENRPEQGELLDVLKNMPRFDLGNVDIAVGRSAAASLFGRRWAAARVERRIRSQAGVQIRDALGIYARVLQAWVRKTFAELQERFDSYADAYRAHLDRLMADKPGPEDEQALRDNLASLAAAASDKAEKENAPGNAA